jgi:hypothetical protein
MLFDVHFAADWMNKFPIPDRKHYKLTVFSLLFTTFHFVRDF